MGIALDFGVSARGSGPGRGHCVVFLGQDTLLSWSGKFNGGGSAAMD